MQINNKLQKANHGYFRSCTHTVLVKRDWIPKLVNTYHLHRPLCFHLSSGRRWMERPPSNLHRLIIHKLPIPFNYNRCPFWLIVCLHSEFILLALMLFPSHTHHLLAAVNEPQKCISVASRDPFLWSEECLSALQGMPGPPGEKGENGDVGAMVSAAISVTIPSFLQRFTLCSRTTRRRGKTETIV